MQHNLIQHHLDNGITLITVPLLNTEAVTSIVLMGVGSRYESDEQRGLAHFTEHMVFKGGIRYTSAAAIAQALDAVGGEFNAFTSQDFTGFYTKTDAKHFELGLDVLSDMVLHASFVEEEMNKEKGVIVEEINMYEDMPMRKVDQVLSDLVYGDTPIGRPILGTKETVSAFTREDFLRYREQFYFGEQCTIVIAGAVQHEQVLETVSRLFGAMPKGAAYAPVQARMLSGERVRAEERTSEQSHLLLAVEGYDISHPKRYVYRILATILGGNMSSRLFTSVREQQGLCYYVRANPDFSTDTGLLITSAGVDNARVPQAVAAIMTEHRRLRDEPVDADELDRAKQYLIGKMLLGLEDSEQIAEFYGMQYVMERRLESPNDIEAALLAVTAEDVQAVAQELFADDRLRLALIGPKQDTEVLNSLLTF